MPVVDSIRLGAHKLISLTGQALWNVVPLSLQCQSIAVSWVFIWKQGVCIELGLSILVYIFVKFQLLLCSLVLSQYFRERTQTYSEACIAKETLVELDKLVSTEKQVSSKHQHRQSIDRKLRRLSQQPCKERRLRGAAVWCRNLLRLRGLVIQTVSIEMWIELFNSRYIYYSFF